MTTRYLALLAAALFFVPAASAAMPLEATLEWREATAVGDVQLTGGAQTVFVPKNVRVPVPETALFLLDAQHITLTATYRDGAHTPLVDADPDRDPQRDQTEIEAAQFRLAAARTEIQLMAIAQDASVPQIRLVSGSMRASGADHISERFTNDVQTTSQNEFSPTVERDGPTVTFETDALRESVTLEGDFVLHLWDLDVTDLAHDGKVWRSGIYTPTGESPGFTDTDVRWQLLTLEVKGGRFTFALPGRSLRVQGDPATSEVQIQGSWDIDGATGDVTLGGKDNRLSSEHLRLAGDLTTHFEPSTLPILSHWQGLASEATARGPLAAGVVAPKSAHGFTWWPFVLGIGIVGAGGAAAWGLYLRPRRQDRPMDAAPEPESALPAHEDPLVVEAIAQMEQGQAAKVIDALEPGFDADQASAPVKAYLLSLAHLKQGHTEQGVVWILKAIEFFPDFAQELRANDAFAAIRGDARIRRHLEQDGVTGYV
jgi:hypothetical protein